MCRVNGDFFEKLTSFEKYKAVYLCVFVSVSENVSTQSR